MRQNALLAHSAGTRHKKAHAGYAWAFSFNGRTVQLTGLTFWAFGPLSRVNHVELQLSDSRPRS